MGIALWHERGVHRPDSKRRDAERPRKPTLDEMGPGVESIPYGKDKPTGDRPAGEKPSGPRSTMGRPGQHGGFKPKRR
jgi:excinuclease ABC subunit B